MPRKLRRAPGPRLCAVGEAGASGDELDSCIAAVAGDADRAAFGRLVQHFAPRLIGFFVAGGAARFEAEAMTLEALTALWRDAACLDARHTTLAAFVFVIARNLSRERLGGPELVCAGAGVTAPGPSEEAALACVGAALGAEP